MADGNRVGAVPGGSGTFPGRLFDCLQVNPAVLADRWYGPGAHLGVGAVLRFRPIAGPGGLPTVAVPARLRLTETAEALGLVVRDLRTVARAGRTLVPAEGCCVVADAYHLPWVPYFGRRHMDHGFLLEPGEDGGAVVVDAYHNETPWGSARPGRWSLTRAELAAALPGDALVATLGPEDRPPAVPGPELDLADDTQVERYVAAYAGHPERAAALRRLTLETWLLARSRTLHAEYAAARGGPAGPTGAETRAHVAAWDRLAESVYLTARRVDRGRAGAETPGLYDRLARRLSADREVFGGAGASGGTAAPTAAPPDAAVPARLRMRVAATVGAVLRADPGPLLDGRLLGSVPGFTSFRLAEIIERLESELRFEFAAEDLVPENLDSLDGLCRAVLRGPRGAAGPSPTHPSGGI